MLNPIGEAGFVLTQKELIFLAALTGADELYGIEDTLSEVDDNQISEEWRIAKEQLENKKYIEVEFDNTVTMDDDLYSLMAACCNPKVFIRATMVDGDSLRARNIYITEKIAVELDQDKLSKNKWIMTPLVNIEKVAANLRECFYTEAEFESENISFEIPLPDFEKLNELINNEDKNEAVEIFKKYGCSDEASDDLYHALKDKNYCVSLLIILLDYDSMSDVISYTYYGGTKCLWKLDASAIGKEGEEEKGIKFTTLAMESLLNEIDKMVFALKGLYSSAVKGDEQHG